MKRLFHSSHNCLKKQTVEVPKLLGRPSFNLKSGLIGLPNTGKSSLFQAITESKLGNPANFPFATIDPEIAKVVVPSWRFDKLCEMYNPKVKTPASLTVHDIAGLVRNASEGKGMGSAFLSNVRSVDGLFQVVRAFEDEEVIHVEESVDPIRDLQIVYDELLLKDMEYVMSFIEVCNRNMKRSPKEAKAELDVAEKVLKHLESSEKRVIDGQWTNYEIDIINKMSLLTAKPSVYLANISENDYMTDVNTPMVTEIQKWVDQYSIGDSVVPISIGMEHRLALMDKSEKLEELEILELKSALSQAIIELRKSLNLISFFTCGENEVREWSIRSNTKAPEAAGVIHKDLEKTFIQALVSTFEDVVECNGDDSVLKSQGKVSARGRDSFIEDGNCVLFKAGAAKK